MDYNQKYLKYKEKYLKLKNQAGGTIGKIVCLNQLTQMSVFVYTDVEGPGYIVSNDFSGQINFIKLKVLSPSVTIFISESGSLYYTVDKSPTMRITKETAPISSAIEIGQIESLDPLTQMSVFMNSYDLEGPGHITGKSPTNPNLYINFIKSRILNQIPSVTIYISASGKIYYTTNKLPTLRITK
jgi:hypothetical protein